MIKETPPIYFPILRAKDGEIEALAWLSPSARKWMRPILDFPKFRPKMGQSAQTLESYFQRRIRVITKAWGAARELCLDFTRYGPEEKAPDGRHITEYVFDLARQARLKVVPVAGPLARRGPGVGYLQAVSHVVASDGRGVVFRVPVEAFQTRGVTERAIADLLELVDVQPQEVDVCFDAESQYGLTAGSADEFALIQSLRDAASAALAIGCRTTIFAASSLPDSLVRHRNGQIVRVARAEYRVWRRVARGETASRVYFGDYGVIYPAQTEADIPRAPPSRVRATVYGEHRLYRGEPRQIRLVAAQAVQDGALDGAAVSWGAQAIRDCATGRGSEGNASNWVARDTNMHIENVLTMLATDLRVDLHIADGVGGGPWLQRVLGFVDSP